MVAVTNFRRASAICVATVRFQIRSYSRPSTPLSPCSSVVRISVPAGRMASWASCAFLEVLLNCRILGLR